MAGGTVLADADAGAGLVGTAQAVAAGAVLAVVSIAIVPQTFALATATVLGFVAASCSRSGSERSRRRPWPGDLLEHQRITCHGDTLEPQVRRPALRFNFSGSRVVATCRDLRFDGLSGLRGLR